MDKPFTAYNGTESFSFVCYSHADDALVYPEIAWLNEQGVRIWYDEGIPGGRIWSREIADRIQSAELVLYYVSPDSLRSEHCSREVHFAFNHGTAVLPIYLDAVELPPDIALNVSHVQALEQRARNHRSRLLASMSTRSSQSEPGTKTENKPPRIAVFPFENLAPATEYDWLGRTLSNKIAGLLHSSGTLDVAPQRDVRRFINTSHSIAELRIELQADYLLEGTMLISGSRFTLDATLLDTRTSRQIWVQSFQEEIELVLEVETRLISQIAAALEVESDGGAAARGTTNSRAYLAHLRHAFPLRENVDQILRAVESQKQAIRFDPQFGNAHTSLAADYFFLSEVLNESRYMELALEHFERALEVGGISPFNAAWCTWSVALPGISGQFDWRRAEVAMRQAMQQVAAYERWLMDPILENHAPIERGYGQLLNAAGLFQEAAEFADLEIQRIRMSRPTGWDEQGIAQRGVPLHYSHAGQLDKAQAILEEDLERRPQIAENYVRRAELCHIPAGRLDAARADLDTYRSNAELVPQQLGKQGTDDNVERKIQLTTAPAEIKLAIAAGNEARARGLIEESGRGELLGRLGDMDGMVAHLIEALKGGNPGALAGIRSYLLSAPDPEGQALHPGYRSLLERSNLSDDWQQELSRCVNELAPITGINASTLKG